MFADDELHSAYARYRDVQAAGDWDAYCDLFTEDAVYVEHEMGTFVGRDAIRAWLVPTMAPLVGWEYPLRWHLVGGDRIVCGWDNVMPTPAGSEQAFSFFGVTILTYAGDGRFCRQEDVYNGKEMEAAMAAWFAAGGRLGPVEP